MKEARLLCNPVVSQEDLAGNLAAQDIILDRTAIARALKISVAWLYGEHG